MQPTLDHEFTPSQGTVPAIFTSTMPYVDTALVCVRVNVGARYETSQEHGIAHFLEHMAFKGTKKRTALDITRDAEEAGGSLNASTSHEKTTYYAHILADSIDISLDILADISLNPTFPPKEIERERKVITQELLEGEDNPNDVLMDALMETAFPQQPLGKTIIGTKKSISSISKEQLHDYKDTYYTQPNITISCTGNVEHNAFVSSVERAFSLPLKEKRSKGEQSSFSSGSVFRQKPIKQTHVALAYEGTSYKDTKRYLIMLFQTILGGGMTSRLFQACRERLGLCYSIHAYPWHFSDTGLLLIASSTDEERAILLIKTIREEIARLCNDMTERELQRAKTLMRAYFTSIGESKTSRDQWISHYLSCVEHPDASWRAPCPSSILDKIDSIDKDHLLDTMNDIFAKEPVISVVGPNNIGSW